MEEIKLVYYPNSVKEAKLKKFKHYFTGKPCKRGHYSLRITSSRECMDCGREKLKDLIKNINSEEDSSEDCILPSSRKEAISKKSKFYFTGQPCIHGHISKRFTNNSTCHECHMPRQRKASINYYHEIKHTEQYKQNVKRKSDKYLSTVSGRLAHGLRVRLRHAIKAKSKMGSAVSDLGCSIEDFMAYMEAKFKDGMTWENHGLYGWHIDHITPLISFDLTDREQFLQACHYTNLQPLWAKDNLSKSNKIL